MSVKGGVEETSCTRRKKKKSDGTYSSDTCNQVYVCVVTQETDFDWYVLNTKTGTSIKDVNMSGHKLPVCFGCVSIGTKIYTIGGRYGSFDPPSFAPTKEIQIYDTLTKTWEFGPEMNAPRYNPIVIFFEDKLYVFGRFCDDEYDDDRNRDILWHSDQPWGEYAICDPATGALNKWCSLSSPPPLQVTVQTALYRHAIDYHQQRFIFWNHAYFCSYDVPTGVWSSLISVVHDIPDNWGWSLNPKVASRNNFVYWYFHGNLFAYDLSRIRSCGPPVCYLQKHPHRPPHEFCHDDRTSPFLIAVDDDELCLIWFAYDDFMCRGKYTDRVCHWTTFQIETLDKADVKEQLPVVPKHSESFGTGNGYCIVNCVLVSQRPNNNNVMNRHDICKFYQKPDIVALMEHLSRAMYVKNYYSYVVNGKDDNVPVNLKQNRKVSVEDLLVSLGLEKYLSIFQEEEIDMKSLKILTEEDLKALGLPMGPRKELLAAISNMGS